MNREVVQGRLSHDEWDPLSEFVPFYDFRDDLLRPPSRSTPRRKLKHADKIILPPEIIRRIFYYVADYARGYRSSIDTMLKISLASKMFYIHITPQLYEFVAINDPHNFQLCFATIQTRPELARCIKVLDMSSFSLVGFRKFDPDVEAFTPESLLGFITLLPSLSEVLLNEHVQKSVDSNILSYILSFGLKCLDFAGMNLEEAIDNIEIRQPMLSSVKRLSFHECNRIQAQLFSNIFSYCVNLTHLDLARTKIKGFQLSLLPESIRLHSLSVSNCPNLGADFFISFLSSHSSVRSLKVLNISYHDESGIPFRMMEIMDSLVPILPSTIEIFYAANSGLNGNHLKILPKEITELSVAGTDVRVEELIEFLPSSKIVHLDVAKVHNLTGNKLIELIAPNMNLEVIEVFESLIPNFQLLLNIEQSPLHGKYFIYNGRGQRHWIVRKDIFEKAQGKDESGSLSGWFPKKINCSTYGSVRGMYIYYSYQR